MSASPRGAGLVAAAALILGNGLLAFLTAAIAPVAPDIAAAFAETRSAESLSKLLLVAPALPMAISAPFIGLLTNWLGLRRVYFTSLALFALFGVSGYFATSLESLLASRFLLGFAAAGVGACGLTLATRLFDGVERQRVLGFQGAAAAGGAIIALLAGGLLGEVSWRAPFSLHLFAFVVLGLAVAALPPMEPVRPDTARGVLDRAFYMIYVVAVGAGVLLFTAPVHVPFLIETLGHTGASARMMAIIPQTLAAVIVASSYPLVRKVLEPWAIVAGVYALIGAGCVMTGLADGLGGVIVGMAIMGAGMGLLLPNFASMIARKADGPRRAVAMGGLLTATFIGEFLSPLVTQPLVAMFGEGGAFFWLGAVVMPLALIAFAFALYRSRRLATT
ncbi:MAG: MFS transporter [Caulobacterales bacterium]|nr:MFS transporter [Caulobacterales bacterium]